MSRNNTELARRAVACKHWRWMRGMSAICDVGNGWRVLRGTDTWEWDDHGSWPGGPPFRDFSTALNREILPDLDDPATLGCLLALVREVWGDDGITTSCTRCGGGTGWSVHRSSPVNGVSALVPILSESEATVLVCALEAASC